jgi:hypothetical protein
MHAPGNHSIPPLALALALACSHPRIPADQSPVNPVRDLESCSLAQPVSEVSYPWAGVAIDPTADSSTPGFAQLVRYRLDPSGRKGRAIVVRLSDPSSGDSLYRGEKRVWAVRADTDRFQEAALSYSYLDPSRPDDLWVYRPTERTVTRTTPPPIENATPLQRTCDVLQRTFPGDRVTFYERSTGWVHSRSKLGRFLTRPVSPRPDRLIKGR